MTAAWPGRDSRQVLALLPAQIRERRPRCVCVLVGANDMWSLPAAAAAADAIRGGTASVSSCGCCV